MTWATVLVLAAATIAMKAAGPVVLGSRPLPPLTERAVDLLPAALFAALLAVQVFGAGDERRLTLDDRVVALVVAAVAVRLRASFLVVVVSACAVTAVLRAVT